MKAARLVVLGVAVAAGGLAAYMASRPGPQPEVVVKQTPAVDTTEVLVAKSDIPTGETVTADNVQWMKWPTSAANASFLRKPDNAKAIEQITGWIARTPFVAGEPIREAKLVNPKGFGFMAAVLPSGMRAISTEISPETGAGGFILPNDHVDVILTRRDVGDKSKGENTTETILTNVRVLAIDQTVEEKNGQKVVIGKTATLELGPRQAEKLSLARKLGTLSLALRSITDNDKPDTPADEDPDANKTSINIVRFGVSTVTAPK